MPLKYLVVGKRSNWESGGSDNPGSYSSDMGILTGVRYLIQVGHNSEEFSFFSQVQQLLFIHTVYSWVMSDTNQCQTLLASYKITQQTGKKKMVTEY